MLHARVARLVTQICNSVIRCKPACYGAVPQRPPVEILNRKNQQLLCYVYNRTCNQPSLYNGLLHREHTPGLYWLHWRQQNLPRQQLTQVGWHRPSGRGHHLHPHGPRLRHLSSCPRDDPYHLRACSYRLTAWSCHLMAGLPAG